MIRDLMILFYQFNHSGILTRLIWVILGPLFVIGYFALFNFILIIGPIWLLTIPVVTIIVAIVYFVINGKPFVFFVVILVLGVWVMISFAHAQILIDVCSIIECSSELLEGALLIKAGFVGYNEQ